MVPYQNSKGRAHSPRMTRETRKVVPERRRRGGHGRVGGQARNHDLDFWRARQIPNRRTALVPENGPDLLNFL